MKYKLTAKQGDRGYSRFAWEANETPFNGGEWDDERAEKKYNPNQPRHPAGTSQGGRWSANGSAGIITFLDINGREHQIIPGTSMHKHMVKQEDGTYKLSPERQALHSKIINDALAGAPTVENPQMYMMGGGPASGKSTMLGAGALDGIPGAGEAVEINSDIIKEKLPEYVSMLASKNPQAAAYVHEESSILSSRLRAAARATSKHVVYDTTGDSSAEKLTGMIGRFRDSGYKINAYYATLDTDLAVRIAEMRGEKTGRYVPEHVIRSTHANVSRTFVRAARTYTFDSVSLYDTNIHNKPRLIARGDRNTFEVTNTPLFARFVRKGQTPDATVPYGDTVQVISGKADDSYPDTQVIERITTEILMGVEWSESTVKKTPATTALREMIEDDISNLPVGAVAVPGHEYLEDDFDALYDGSYETTHKSVPEHDGEGVENQQYVAIKKADDEKQIVYGEVYAPDYLDTYGEYMTAEDIEIMAHRFMQLDLRTAIDTQHDNIPNGAYPVESFVAREGDPDYTPGAWVLGVKIPDPILWRQVKSGELNGFSFQSLVKPTTVEVEYAVIRDHVGKTEPQADHDHIYLVELDEIGNVIGGRTSKAADGHFHVITRASHTDEAADHTHRFFL